MTINTKFDRLGKKIKILKVTSEEKNVIIKFGISARTSRCMYEQFHLQQ